MSQSVEGTENHMFPCQSCGANLEFKPGAESLNCPYCGSSQNIAPSEGEGESEGARTIQEYDFHDAVNLAKQRPAKDLMEGGRAVQCESCGAETVIAGQSDHCAFCGSPVVVAVEVSDEIFVPESVLPFKLERREAKSKFETWVAGRWFAPNDLKKRAKTQGMDGVYMPYWTYDSETSTRYFGQRGEYYYVTESYTDSEGKRQTRQVRKTRWYPASGSVYVSFDDVLICASTSLPVKITRGLEPWDLEALKPYAPAYLAGFIAERYKVGLEEGFERAQERMDPEIRTAIRHDIGGDTQRILSMSVSHQNVKYKNFLFPVWISSFRYKEKVYRFMVNARTGQVSGERPWSWVKITLAVLVVVAIIAGIVWYTQTHG